MFVWREWRIMPGSIGWKICPCGAVGSQERRNLGTGAAWDWEHKAGLDTRKQGILCGCSGTSSHGRFQPALGQSPQALQTFPGIFF